MTAETLFALALEKPAGPDREAFLDAACGSDRLLRNHVARLLAADDRSRGILDQGPAAGPPTEGWGPTAELIADAPGTCIGPYKLVEQIGEGGMGTVHLAQQTDPVRRQVALKVIRAGMDSRQVVARFEAERQALALMDHPNIARVLDGGVTPEGRPYFAMELVRGVPITRYCDERKLSLNERLELFAPVCHAVQHAHQKGVIHRDLKPSNILVALYDGRPVPRVIDFGVAKATGQPLTEKTLVTGLGAVVGTMEYMSPEQAELNQLDVDTRSDIYSLGVLLFELLTGTTPLQKKRVKEVALLEVLRLVREEEAPRPSTRLSTTEELPSIAANRGVEPWKLSGLVRGELDWIVMKALEKDRSRRYETADAFAADVRRYLADEPVQACPPSAGYRTRKFVRRHWRELTFVSAFVLLLITAVAALSVALVAVDRERTDKQTALESEGKRRKQARAALDAMSSQIIEDWLAKQPVLLPEHEQFLEQALHFYEEFAADTGQEEESRAGVAQAYRRVGEIRFNLGRRKEAEAAWERSRDLFSRLAADFPHDSTYPEDLARICNTLGDSYSSSGRSLEAEVELRRGQTLYRGLAEKPGSAPAVRYGLAQNYLAMGILLRRLGRPQEAEESYSQALALLKKLSDEYPDEPRYASGQAQVYLNLSELLVGNTGRSREAILNDPGRFLEAVEAAAQVVVIYERLANRFQKGRGYREDLAAALNNQGNLLRDVARYPEAEEAFRRALTIQKELVEEYPGVPLYKRALAMTLNNLGILFKNSGQPEKAENMYRQSLDIHRELVATYPLPFHQNDLAGAMVNLARLLLARKDLEGARRLLEEAVPYHQAALKLNPHNSRFIFFFRLNRWRMAETLLELKEHAGAAEAAEEFLRMGVEPARDAYTAAGLLAGCARLAMEDKRLPETTRQELAAAYGDRAVTALRQAIEKGAKVTAQIKKDSSLDPLRSREDFQKLLATLEAKNEP